MTAHPCPTVLIPDVPFRVVDGQTLMAEIIRPDPLPAAPLPAVIYIHGGAWMFGDRTSNRGQLLAEQGFFTLSVDYRLSGQAIFPAQLEDVRAAVAWLRARAADYHVDPDRIGVWGHSAGAHLAALLGTSGHECGPAAVQAVVALAPPTDFLQMGGWHDAPDAPEAQLVGGPLRERAELVRQANPISHLRSVCPPFLIIHGDADEIVPVGQSELLAAALRAEGSPVQFLRLPGAGHNFGSDEASWAEVQPTIVAFFKQHLRLYGRRT